ncbi:MAG: 16S rRNA (uracil(1498)-N(3))-methyltransferase [Bacteroidetes bacterium]|nr:16S rRNA (uracil(1498)-N(3))-methyltransferase [Bacteroidota bacterium]
MHLSYTPTISDATLVLSEEESKHCINVLRMKENDELILVDGIGGYYKAKITQAHSKKCEVNIVETQKDFQKRNFSLHIACAPTKSSDRFEWFLEKATEIGLDKITPLQCEHSERTVVKPERLLKVLIAAMKQSLKAYLPVLEETLSFKKLVEQTKTFEGQKFIAHCYPGEKKRLAEVYEKNKNVLVLIGPEGDFSKAEIELTLSNGFEAVSLSNSRLRTETAALVACHTVNLINEV